MLYYSLKTANKNLHVYYNFIKLWKKINKYLNVKYLPKNCTNHKNYNNLNIYWCTICDRKYYINVNSKNIHIT